MCSLLGEISHLLGCHTANLGAAALRRILLLHPYPPALDLNKGTHLSMYSSSMRLRSLAVGSPNSSASSMRSSTASSKSPAHRVKAHDSTTGTSSAMPPIREVGRVSEAREGSSNGRCATQEELDMGLHTRLCLALGPHPGRAPHTAPDAPLVVLHAALPPSGMGRTLAHLAGWWPAPP